MTRLNLPSLPQFSAIPRAACVVAAVLLATAGGDARAEDCEVKSLDTLATGQRLRDRSEANFNCLMRQIEALRAEQTRLQAKIKALEAASAPASSIIAYRNQDGTVSRSERQLGPATFVVAGDRNGNPRSLELDYELVLEMCADADGCFLTLGLEGVRVEGEPLETRFSHGPCGFHIDENHGTWALSGLCVEEPLPTATSESLWGRDGDATPLGGTEQDGRAILAFGDACYLAESMPERQSTSLAEPRLQRDTTRDLHLVAAGTSWKFGGRFPVDALAVKIADPIFQCRLTIRD